MSRLLVTGAGGQLGRALAQRVPDAVLLDRAALDVTIAEDVGAAVAEARPEIVVHAAAWTDVDGAEEHEDEARAVNVTGTRNVVTAAAGAGALVVYVSSDYVFPGDATRPYAEEDPTGPLSAYGRTKLDGEREAAAAPRHLVVRTSWVYGRGRNFVRSILDAARTAPELTVVDDQVGRPTHAGDLAGGLLELARSSATGTFHLTGAGEPCTWADVAGAALDAAAALGPTPRPPIRRVTTEEYEEDRTRASAPRPRYSVLDCSKAAAAGVTLRPWRAALAEYVAETVSPELEVG